MRNDRISWIDVARGIGIILVVYGHALSADSFRFIIYSFHMPLFFFLSGLVFSYRPDQPAWKFIRKNIRAILYPYFFFAVICFLLWFMTKHPDTTQVIKQFLSIFYGNGNNGLLQFNNLLWFLPCLFLSRVGLYALLRIRSTVRFLLPVLFTLSLVGYGMSSFFPFLKLPFGFETALTATVFVGLGFLFMPQKDSAYHLLQKHIWVVAVSSLIVCFAFAILNFREYGLQVDLRVNRLNNYFFTYLAALAGVVATTAFSMKIQKNSVLEFIGQRSLVVFIWHLFVFSYISQFLSLTHLGIYLRMLPPFMLPLIYSALSILIILVVSESIMYGSKKIKTSLEIKRK